MSFGICFKIENEEKKNCVGLAFDDIIEFSRSQSVFLRSVLRRGIFWLKIVVVVCFEMENNNFKNLLAS